MRCRFVVVGAGRADRCCSALPSLCHLEPVRRAQEALRTGSRQSRSGSRSRRPRWTVEGRGCCVVVQSTLVRRCFCLDRALSGKPRILASLDARRRQESLSSRPSEAIAARPRIIEQAMRHVRVLLGLAESALWPAMRHRRLTSDATPASGVLSHEVIRTHDWRRREPLRTIRHGDARYVWRCRRAATWSASWGFAPGSTSLPCESDASRSREPGGLFTAVCAALRQRCDHCLMGERRD